MNETLQQFCQRILPVVQAGAEEKEIEFLSKLTDEWQIKIAGGFDSIHEYRIAQPKATPLPITPEMWAMIDPKYKWATYDYICGVQVFEGKPNFRKNFTAWFGENVSNEMSSQLPLTIDTAGIVPELSMTERPDCDDESLTPVFIDGVRIGTLNKFGEITGGHHDPDLTRKELDRLSDEHLAKVALDWVAHGVETALRDVERKPLPKIDGRDRVTTTHINTITGVVQVITTIK